MVLELDNIRQAEGLTEALADLKIKIEQRLNLDNYPDEIRPITLAGNKIMRICLLAGLSSAEERSLDNVENLQLSKTSIRIPASFFTLNNLKAVYSALLKLRYKDVQVNWELDPLVSRIINSEILRGKELLMKEGVLEEWLQSTIRNRSISNESAIPFLDLSIGEYEDEIEARLNINGREIANNQIIVAGTTGSGKSNLLAVLINQIRKLSTETPYPVNFLLFDYKGEFSDPANNSWLGLFDTNRGAILDPIQNPLPFTPFKDFTGRPINEINLYSTGMANALCAIDNARISANMSNRLSEAIINTYKETKAKAITFEKILNNYTKLQQERDQNNDDSVKSVLKQLIRSNLFASEDRINLINESFIIKMDGFPKDGPIAKAIVYFVISKLNNIYEQLPKQVTNDRCVEIRHFSIIDEAHYMLNFDNKPLRDLIATGRNKGLSIILATQNMDSFKSEYCDFYANAQYPLIMKQQSINDVVIRDLFGVSGRDLNEIKEAIAGLQKGELIIKNPTALLLGMGKKYKKIKVTHLI